MTHADDATALMAHLAAGEHSSEALTQTCLDAISAQDGQFNAFCAINREAIADAKASDRRRAAGEPLSALDGLPIAVKDNLVVAGMPCTWGSRLFADYVPSADELPVARLRAAGAVIVGKTNVPEFTLEGYTANALHGVTRNPWNVALTPGGSSGGSVAAVAANLVPVAVGTDGGGSIRRPAAHTGLVGLKPSIGRIARGGGLAQLLLDFEVFGPLARSVRDVRLLMSVLAGPDPRDHRSLHIPGAAGPAKHPLSILYVPRFAGAPVDPQISTAVGSVADCLADLGHDVREGALPFATGPLDSFWPNVGKWGLAALRAGQDRFDDLASPQYVEMARAGEALPAAALYAGLEAIATLRNQTAGAFTSIDLILTPATAAMPWAADIAYPGEIDGTPVGPRGHAVFTGWVNASGQPAIALPAPVEPDALPVGFQLVAAFGREALLLEVADAYAAACPAAFRVPHCGLYGEDIGS
ncbi:MAG: amidase [Alphaproteobacteria bacterium]|nr:amidase [Alphaproteobacteria bacterium]